MGGSGGGGGPGTGRGGRKDGRGTKRSREEVSLICGRHTYSGEWDRRALFTFFVDSVSIRRVCCFMSFWLLIGRRGMAGRKQSEARDEAERARGAQGAPR